MKKRYIVLINLLVLIVCGSYFAYACIDYTKQIDIRDVLKEDCENYFVGNTEGLSDNIISFCKEKYLKKDGFLNMHFLLVLDKFNPVALPIAGITIILAPIWVCIFFKNKLFSYYETRLSYPKVLKKILKETYRFILIFPIIMLGVFLFEIWYNGFDCSLSLASPEWSAWTIYHPILFIIIYLFNIVLYLSTFTNITLVWARKNKNYITTVIASLLTVISIQLFFEYVIKITSVVNLLNFFRLHDRYGIGITLLFGISCCLVSWIAVYFVYKNKEKLYLDLDIEK